MSEPQKKESRRIRSVRFVESVPFGGTEASFIIIEKGKCDRVSAARLESDGSAVAIDKAQRSDGLLFEREWNDRSDNTAKTEAVFVYAANIRGIVY